MFHLCYDNFQTTSISSTTSTTEQLWGFTDSIGNVLWVVGMGTLSLLFSIGCVAFIIIFFFYKKFKAPVIRYGQYQK